MKTETSRASLVTGPTSEPVTLTQAKKQLEIAPSETDHDDHIDLLIQAAREQWEHDTDSACLTQTWRVNLESVDSDEIYLPKRPVASITSVKYYDTSNVQQTLSTSVYGLDAANRAIRLKHLQDWPTTVLDRWDTWEITYVCGYASAALVPAVAKQAMLLLVAHNFENRDMIMSESLQTLPVYEALVRRYMRSSYP